MTPRCGRAMRLFEAVWGPLPDGLECGRREGHRPPCRSVPSLERQRPKDLARSARWERGRRERERQARQRAVLAEALRGFDCDGWRHAV